VASPPVRRHQTFVKTPASDEWRTFVLSTSAQIRYYLEVCQTTKGAILLLKEATRSCAVSRRAEIFNGLWLRFAQNILAKDPREFRQRLL
jgi:hypothetical protein